MKPIFKILMVMTVLLSYIACTAQTKDLKTINVPVSGNCDMCKATIEKAGNDKKAGAKVSWNKDTKIATIAYNAKQTSPEAILKRIALAGYDNEQFRAPDEVYAQLPGCCQYERAQKTSAVSKAENQHTAAAPMSEHNHDQHMAKPEADALQPVFDQYFALKDALVKSDAGVAAGKAKELAAAIDAVNMEKLGTEEHQAWMKVMKPLATQAKSIAASKKVDQQRTAFSSLSAEMYTLAKSASHKVPYYYQQCPMYNEGQGAHWLSKESGIKNPYYGNAMLTCGKTVETIAP